MGPRQLRVEAERLRAQAAAFEARARVLETAALELERLPARALSANVSNMDTANRGLAISRGKAQRPGSWIYQAASDRGHSLRSLARALGVSDAILSMIGAGKRALTDDMRARIEAIPLKPKR